MGLDRLITDKSLLALKVAGFISPVFMFLEKYLFDDWEFLKFLIILILIDSAWGVWDAISAKELSKEGFQKGLEKLAIYGTLLVIGHILKEIKSGNEAMWFSYFTSLIHSYMVVNECISILEKLARRQPKWVPNWLLDKLKSFRDRGTNHTQNGKKDHDH